MNINTELSLQNELNSIELFSNHLYRQPSLLDIFASKETHIGEFQSKCLTCSPNR